MGFGYSEPFFKIVYAIVLFLNNSVTGFHAAAARAWRDLILMTRETKQAACDRSPHYRATVSELITAGHEGPGDVPVLL